MICAFVIALLNDIYFKCYNTNIFSSNFQVHEFISATKEIVILDFHNFPKGFKSDAIHEKLMDMIVRKFKSYIIPYNEDYTYAKFR